MLIYHDDFTMMDNAMAKTVQKWRVYRNKGYIEYPFNALTEATSYALAHGFPVPVLISETYDDSNERILGNIL
jgi:hypothetical protein